MNQRETKALRIIKACLSGDPKAVKVRIGEVQFTEGRGEMTVSVAELRLSQVELFRLNTGGLIRLSCDDHQSVPGDARPALALTMRM